MGLYNVVCQGCQKRFQWFSGAVNQLCEQCNDKLVNDSNDNKSIFSKLTEQEMHDLLNPHAKAGRIIDALEKERDALKTELTKCKQALEQTNDGRPSEWAYSILRKERDELKAHLRDATDYNLELKAEVELLKEKDIAAWETASHWEKEADRLEVILQFEKTKSATLEAEVRQLEQLTNSIHCPGCNNVGEKRNWSEVYHSINVEGTEHFCKECDMSWMSGRELNELDKQVIAGLEAEVLRRQYNEDAFQFVLESRDSEKTKSLKYREALEQIARQDHRVHILTGQRIARQALEEDK